MAGWQDELRALAASLASRVRRGTNALGRLVDRDPYHIVGYRGYAANGRVLLLARVLQDEALPVPDPSHSKLRNLVAMLKRLERDPLPFARVRVRLPGGERELIADDEGFIRHWVELGTPLQPGWGSIRLELADPAAGVPGIGHGLYLTPPASAAYGVISDMDDTVLQSHVTDFIRAAGTVLLENARTRLPFPGVAAFYRALTEGRTGGAGNPIFYVSSCGIEISAHRSFGTRPTRPASFARSSPLIRRHWRGETRRRGKRCQGTGAWSGGDTRCPHRGGGPERQSGRAGVEGAAYRGDTMKYARPIATRSSAMAMTTSFTLRPFTSRLRAS